MCKIDTLSDLEGWLLEEGTTSASTDVRGPIFIVAAPRTGSTILYQSMIEVFRLPYIANLTNTYFPKTPIFGFSIQATRPAYGSISGESRFGKTEGLMQPSEGSAVMAHWFGGGHPSEVVSRTTLPGRERHLSATISAAWHLFERPLLIKNAWNCFRIESIAATLPSSAFVWVRRDIAHSAQSDLHARYVVQGDLSIWNSATPRNVEELKKRPYWEQVVENQFEFARAISDGLAGLPAERFAEVWYEDLCLDSEGTLEALGHTLKALDGLALMRSGMPEIALEASEDALDLDDALAVTKYVESNTARFESLRHHSCRSQQNDQQRL